MLSRIAVMCAMAAVGLQLGGADTTLPQLIASNGRFVTVDGAIEVQLRGTSLDHNFAVPSLFPGQVAAYKSLGWNLVRDIAHPNLSLRCYPSDVPLKHHRKVAREVH